MYSLFPTWDHSKKINMRKYLHHRLILMERFVLVIPKRMSTNFICWWQYAHNYGMLSPFLMNFRKGIVNMVLENVLKSTDNWPTWQLTRFGCAIRISDGKMFIKRFRFIQFQLKSKGWMNFKMVPNDFCVTFFRSFNRANSSVYGGVYVPTQMCDELTLTVKICAAWAQNTPNRRITSLTDPLATQIVYHTLSIALSSWFCVE